MAKKQRQSANEELPLMASDTTDLSYELIELEANNACGTGKLTVKAVRRDRFFILTFTRNDQAQSFAIRGFSAKKLAAYIALWA